MVTSLNQKSTARDAGYEMMQYIAARITATTASPTTIIQRVGTLPQGAIITGIQNRITTTFTGAAAPFIGLGQTAVYTDVASNLPTAAGAIFSQGLGTLSQPLTADVDIWAEVTGTATTGDAFISVWFAKPVA